MGLRAGRMRHRITLRQPSTPTDGEPDKTWSDYATVWASVVSTGGSERLRGRQVDSTVTTIVTIRWTKELANKLAADWLITHDGRTLGIVAVYDPTGLRERLEIQCREQG